jgi:hypothetical protein
VTPRGWAATETPTQDLGVFAVYNGRTEVSSEQVGRERRARAVSRADAISFLGGMVVIFNPRWEATAVSGSREQLTGTFDLDGGTLFGMFRNREQAHADVRWVAESIAFLFSSLGAQLRLPEVQVDGDEVRVTPMTFQLVDIPLGRLGIGPLVQLFRQTIDDYYLQLRESGCDGKSQAQLLQLVEGIVTGNGSVSLPVGGVSARTDDTYYPPIEAPPTPEEVEEPTVEVAGEPSVDAPSAFVAPSSDTSPFVPVAEALPFDDAPLSAPAPVEEVAVEERAGGDGEIEFAAPASASERRFENGAAGGAAAVLGGLALALGLALAVADRLSMLRGGRRVIPE